MNQHCETECPTSPCAKDRVRKRLGTGMYLIAPMMLLYGTYAAMYATFQLAWPALFIAGLVAISERQFFKMCPWNIRRAVRESCLCKPCENFGLYEASLDEVLEVLLTALAPEVNEEEEADDQGDPILKDSHFKKLQAMNKLDRRITKVKHLLCEGAFEHQKMDCLNSKCKSCGFKAVWSLGLRKKLVTASGELRADQHPIWLKQVTWNRFKTKSGVGTVVSDGTAEGEDKQTLREECTGSIIEFLDDHERVSLILI